MRYLQSYEDGMGFAGYADNDGALFDGFGGILDLEDSSLRGAVPGLG